MSGRGREDTVKEYLDKLSNVKRKGMVPATPCSIHPGVHWRRPQAKRPPLALTPVAAQAPTEPNNGQPNAAINTLLFVTAAAALAEAPTPTEPASATKD